jgi:nucleotide-binding universal stress UspA family protein
MLFNSPIFLFLFLPVTLAGFFLFARLAGRNAALGFLLFACLIFYAYSSVFNFVLFVAAVIANFLFGYAIGHFKRNTRAWLIGGIVLNLCLIGYFKYAGLIVSSVNEVFSLAFLVPHVVLPVGISFYTFEQISYLVETHQSGRYEPMGRLLVQLASPAFQETVGGYGLPQKAMLQLTRSEQAWLKEFLESLSAETLTKARERARAAGADQIHLESQAGDVAQSVIAIAKEKAADVIVVGKRGAGLVERLLLGSVSEKVVRLAPLPVIVIP